MGSLSLVCPMCCGETFNNPQSLKYHLLSMTDNLYCPGCSQRSDSVMALIQHLDRCGQNSDSDVSPESDHELHHEQLEEEQTLEPIAESGQGPGQELQCEPDMEQELEGEINEEVAQDMQVQETETDTEVLMDTNVGEIDQRFLATVNDGGIMIVGEPQTIQVDENGDIKVVEKMDTEESNVNGETVNFSMMQKASHAAETHSKDLTEKHLVAITSTTDGTDKKDKSVIAILPSDTELLDNESNSLMNMGHINEVAEGLDEDGLLQVKEELCEVEPEAVYSCTSCDMSFNSVVEHIKQYHDGQEVLLEIADQLDDLPITSPPSSTPTEMATVTVPGTAVTTSPETANSRHRQPMNTLRTEECVDSVGRLYTRKVVQIERFWDKSSQSQSTFQTSDSASAVATTAATTPMLATAMLTTKSPMIEKFFSNVEGVKVREKRVTTSPLRMYKCNQCLQQFSKLGNFRVHACLHGSNRCDNCDQTFATPKALQLHAKVHEGEPDPNQKTFVCETCGTEFCSHKSLRLHSRMHAPVRARHVDAPEGTANATFTCPECGKTLSESYKEAHMALHSGDSVTCTVCNRKFDSADSLAMHAAVHTELAQSHSPTPPAMETPAEAAEPTKPYKCHHCGRRFTRPHEKVKHERIHTGEKPHVCEVCGKTFRVSYCLTLHMRTHTGVRPYGCQHCGKRFKASSVYNHHLLTHGEERAYTCPFCPKTFKTRVQLAGHKNSHTKPFRCTECSRPFASLYAARAHIQTHKKDNNLKFSCYICGASYGRAFALKDHLKQHGQDVLAAPEPAREEEVHEAEEFLLAEEEVAEDELVIPSPLPVARSSEAEDTE